MPVDLLDEDTDDHDLFPVLPPNWSTVSTFLSLSTQWRVGFSGVVGLDYGAIEAMLRMQQETMTPAVFAGIQVMERAVLEALDEEQ